MPLITDGASPAQLEAFRSLWTSVGRAVSGAEIERVSRLMEHLYDDSISASYISQLASKKRNNVSVAKLASFVAAFEVVIQVGAILAVIWHYRATLFSLATRMIQPGPERGLVGKLLLGFLPAAIAGVLLIHETGPAGYPFSVVQGNASERFDLVTEDKNMGRSDEEGWISLDQAKTLFSMAG